LKLDDPAVVPPGVVTLKNQSVAFCPQGRGGTTTAIEVEPVTTKLVADIRFSVASVRLVPNVTADAPVKFVPVRVTVFPPDDDPVAATLVVKVGADQL
jgi:hypothetical protein